MRNDRERDSDGAYLITIDELISLKSIISNTLEIMDECLLEHSLDDVKQTVRQQLNPTYDFATRLEYIMMDDEDPEFTGLYIEPSDPTDAGSFIIVNAKSCEIESEPVDGNKIRKLLHIPEFAPIHVKGEPNRFYTMFENDFEALKFEASLEMQDDPKDKLAVSPLITAWFETDPRSTSETVKYRCNVQYRYVTYGMVKDTPCDTYITGNKRAYSQGNFTKIGSVRYMETIFKISELGSGAVCLIQSCFDGRNDRSEEVFRAIHEKTAGKTHRPIEFMNTGNIQVGDNAIRVDDRSILVYIPYPDELITVEARS